MNCQAQRVMSSSGGQYTSSISKGSILLNIFNSDLDDGRECNFSDNTKLGGVFNTPYRCTVIWKYLERLKKRADENFTHFSKGKCKLHAPVYADSQLVGNQFCTDKAW